MSIVVRTLSEQVFEIIRDRIITGVFGKDLPIRQDALAAELGVSKIPLREALARLEQEGLLTSQANRGYFVRPMTAAEADEIYALRLAIEPAAAGAASLIAGDEDREAAITTLEALEAASNDGTGNVALHNRHFHVALVRPGGRLLTTQLVERLEILSERYVIAHLKPEGRDTRAHHEHRSILDAWLARDPPLTDTLLARHIGTTREDLSGQLDAIS